MTRDNQPGRRQFSHPKVFGWEIYENARAHGLGRPGFDPLTNESPARTDDSYVIEDLSICRTRRYGSAMPDIMINPDILHQPTGFAPKYPEHIGKTAIGVVRMPHN